MTVVMVLFGGQSGEHGISCATAAGVLKAIDRSRYDVLPVGITPDGRWVRMPDNPEIYELNKGKTYTIAYSEETVALLPGTDLLVDVNDVDQSQDPRNASKIDVVLPLLHGPYGEDGTVQGLLEMSRVPYVGCGVLSSAACMDKHVTKVLLDAADIPAGKWHLVDDRRWRTQREDVLEAVNQLGYPVFVKPCRAGSSIGISRVDSEERLSAAIEEARRHDPRVIVEAMLTGFEIECAVLQGREGGPPRITSPGRIKMTDDVEFYDYQTKYGDTGQVSLEIPAKMPETLVNEVKKYAAASFEALECEGLARVDFFVDVDQSKVTVNEINTMPGFTPFSMFPALWAYEGIAYPQLVNELIELALMRPQGLR